MGKDKVKIRFDIQVKRVARLPERLNGGTVFIMWRRGSKECSGMTKRGLVKDQEAVWSEDFNFVVSLFRDNDDDEFESKAIAFALKEDQIGKQKQSKTLSVAKINLADHVEDDGSEPVPIEFKIKKSKTPAQFYITLTAHWLKINDDDVKGGEAGGAHRSLTDTSDNLSLSLEDLSPNDSGGEEDDDDMGAISDSDEETADPMQKKIALLEHECYERGKTIRNREEQIEKLRQEEKRWREGREEVAHLREKMEEQKKEISKGEEAIRALEVAQRELKVFKAGKSGTEVNAELEKELQAVKAELGALQKAREKEVGSGAEAKKRAMNDAKEMNEKLQKEMEQKDKKIGMLNTEVQLLKRELNDKKAQLSNTVSGGKARLSLATVTEMLYKTVYDLQVYEYDDEAPAASKAIHKAIVGWELLSSQDKDNKFLVDTILHAIEIASTHGSVHAMGYWLSTACHLLHFVRKELNFDYLKSKRSADHPITAYVISLQKLISTLYQRLLTNAYDELGTKLAPAMLQQPSARAVSDSTNWSCVIVFILPILDKYLASFYNNKNFRSITKQFFKQLVHFIDHQLFTDLLTERSYCTCSNAFQIKLEVSQLEEWLSQSLHCPELRIKLLSQAANVLVMVTAFADSVMREQICPDIPLQQLKQLLEAFTPDKLSPETVPPKVIAKLREEAKTTSSAPLPAPTAQIEEVNFDFAPEDSVETGGTGSGFKPAAMGSPRIARLDLPGESKKKLSPRRHGNSDDDKERDVDKPKPRPHRRERSARD